MKKNSQAARRVARKPRARKAYSPSTNERCNQILVALSHGTTRQIEINQTLITRVEKLDQGIAELRRSLIEDNRITCFVWGAIRVEEYIQGYVLDGVPHEAKKRIVEYNIVAAPQKLAPNEEAIFKIDPMMTAMNGRLQLDGPFAFVDLQVGRNTVFASSSPSDDGFPPCAKTVVFDTVHVGQRIQARVRRIDP